MINKLMVKIKSIKFYEEKVRFLLFSVVLLLLLWLAFKLFEVSYASYQSHAKLNANIERAIYLIDVSKTSFNIDPEQIVPSDEPFVYKFSVSNFNDSLRSDIDIKYTLKVTTTTNLPLNFNLYRNESYDNATSVDLLEAHQSLQDSDGAWYNVYNLDNWYTLNHNDKVTDIFTLVIKFPKVYSTNTIYADAIENIEISIDSKQIIE